jgi:hypothetical protein
MPTTTGSSFYSSTVKYVVIGSVIGVRLSKIRDTELLLLNQRLDSRNELALTVRVDGVLGTESIEVLVVL